MTPIEIGPGADYGYIFYFGRIVGGKVTLKKPGIIKRLRERLRNAIYHIRRKNSDS